MILALYYALSAKRDEKGPQNSLDAMHFLLQGQALRIRTRPMEAGHGPELCKRALSKL